MSRAGSCSVEGCAQIARARGLCGCHYQRLRSTGTTDKLERAKVPWRTCSINGCGAPSRTRQGGSCEKHYYRFRRTGKYDAPVFGAWSTTDAGYVMRLDRNHPVSSSRGYLYQHRMVLFDAIGAGVHPCHWCKDEVEWGAHGRRRLVVDHIDSDKRNNVLSNLVPSCHRCNSTRGLFISWVMAHRDDPFLASLFHQSRDHVEAAASSGAD